MGGVRVAGKENRENGERKNERKGGKAREREMEEKEGTHKVDGLRNFEKLYGVPLFGFRKRERGRGERREE